MAFPAGVQTCVLTAGRYFNATGVDYATSVSVTPTFGSAEMITWGATGESMLSTKISDSETAGNVWSIEVPVVNQAGWVDPSGNAFTMWAYQVTITAGDKTVVKSVQPLVGQSTIDIDLIPGGANGTPSTTPLAVVTSVAGLTGPVSVAQLIAAGLGGGGGGSVDPETVRDIIGSTLVEGTGIDITVNDAGDTVTVALSAHTHVVDDIANSTTVGKALMTAVDAAAGRTAIGAGTSSLVLGFTTGTAMDGALGGVDLYWNGTAWPTRPSVSHPVTWWSTTDPAAPAPGGPATGDSWNQHPDAS